MKCWILSALMLAGPCSCLCAEEGLIITIDGKYAGWVFTNSTVQVVYTNGGFLAGTNPIPTEAVSNLLGAARAKPIPEVDPANLGLTASWLARNYPALLASFGGDAERGYFPKASAKEQSWLTNALGDLEVLSDILRGWYRSFHTDDYPEFDIRVERETDGVLERVLLLHSRSQTAPMIPWEVTEGTNRFSTHDAAISRALLALLPPGFVNRERLELNLVGSIASSFLGSEKVSAYLRDNLLNDTLGTLTNRLGGEFELRDVRIYSGWVGQFPDHWTGTLHRTNWPARLTWAVQSSIQAGIAKELGPVLETAEARVARLLKYRWLAEKADGTGNISISFKGSPADHQALGRFMRAAGLGTFYERLQPDLQRAEAIVVWEGFRRSSEWALLPDGKLLLLGFTGIGVFDWKPEELGYTGPTNNLAQSYTINRVAVYVGTEGKIEQVVPAAEKDHF